MSSNSSAPGRILGIGVDVVRLSRFETFARDHAGKLDDMFTARELAREPSTLATAFAIKEAALKAIGTLSGWELDWTQIEAYDLDIVEIRLYGRVATEAGKIGIGRFHGSVARTDSYVVATTIAVSQ